MNGTAVSGEPVVIVEVGNGRVNLKKGCISSADANYDLADPQTETVVRGDRRFGPMADSPEQAYQRSFRVNDIHLLKEQEAQSLQDPKTAQSWFGTIYQDEVVNRILRALKRLK
jgi:hypothetical protein